MDTLSLSDRIYLEPTFVQLYFIIYIVPSRLIQDDFRFVYNRLVQEVHEPVAHFNVKYTYVHITCDIDESVFA